MARNPDHQMFARPTHDERARQDFVGQLKLFSGRTVRPLNREVFRREAAPAWEAKHGRPPETQAEISEAMHENLHYRSWSALHRATQEQMWDAVSESLEREEPRLKQVYHELTDAPAKHGSLELDPDFEVPDPIDHFAIHLQPGTYALNRGEDDFMAGALYEAGGALFSKAQGIGTTESKADVMMRFLDARYPGFKPTRILDMACSAGNSSTPYAMALPDAEVHAIDVGAGLLRYAHARAEALGVAVHFHQRSVADAGFEDGYFDLVVSHNAMHELSADSTAAMMKESYRLLKPGGICLHQDVPLRYERLPEYDKFEWGWDELYNGEPFWSTYATNDCETLLRDAGFADEDLFVGFADQIDKTVKWFVACARKPEKS
jgi:SAM-dependent methyltransferase